MAAKRVENASVLIPKLPTGKVPVSVLIQRAIETFEARQKRRKAVKWLPVTFPETEPFGVFWWGDPHLDAKDCHWPMVLDHIQLCRQPGVYAATVGDMTNNWVGRLMREFANQNATQEDARRMVAWFFKQTGMRWAPSISGNHDAWNDGEEILSHLIGDAFMASWEARLEFRDSAGHSWRVHAAHDFKGSSVYNKIHGPAKAAKFSGGAAELYVCGHKHTWGYGCEEQEETGIVTHSLRVRGYKWHDDYAVVNGFLQGNVGASALTIFNPRAKDAAGRVMVFSDPALGVEVLQRLRTKPKPQARPQAQAKTKAKPQPRRKKPVAAKRGPPRKKSADTRKSRLTA